MKASQIKTGNVYGTASMGNVRVDKIRKDGSRTVYDVFATTTKKTHTVRSARTFLKEIPQEKADREIAKKEKPSKKPCTKLCRCGCGQTVSRESRNFRMGHDARFHGRIKKLSDGRLTMAELVETLGETGAYAVPFYKVEHVD